MSPFLTLLNPVLGLVFCTAFLLLWSYQRSRPYLGLLALCYFCTAIGFFLQYFTLPVGFEWTRMISNAAFLGAGSAIATAMAWRYGRRIPLAGIVFIAVPAFAAVGWFMFFDPDVVWRVYLMNFAVGALILLAAAEVQAATPKVWADRLLLGVLIVNGLLLYVRTAVTLRLEGGPITVESVHYSTYWLLFISSQAIISVIVVLVLLAIAGLDIVHDLRTENETDQLSGALNRRGFEKAADGLLRASADRPLPTSLFIADLDHFKSVNDSFGHHVGDHVITAFAAVVRQVIGDDHPIGRIGGEEFAVIVRGADLQTARLMAEGVRVAFSAAPMPGRAPDSCRPLTASFGVAELRPGERYVDVLSRADAALYEAKNAGRDCVRIASGDRTLQHINGAATYNEDAALARHVL